MNIPLIAMTGNSQSVLAKMATVHLDIAIEKEACPLGLAPTTSTTVSLVMGDALAIALLQSRGFTPEDFAMSHPGGTLGRRLLLRVQDIMHAGENIPIISPNTTLSEALIVMTEKKLGMTCITDENQHLLGIFTDGDLRRAMDKKTDLHQTLIEEIMTHAPKSISPTYLAIDALKIMEDKKITSLPIVSEENKILGVIHLHDLLRARVV